MGGEGRGVGGVGEAHGGDLGCGVGWSLVVVLVGVAKCQGEGRSWFTWTLHIGDCAPWRGWVERWVELGGSSYVQV